ncbi:MAG TPA: M56 family metallopeptidase [Bryobacteraceae bacterium]|jgi:uncharacterized protein (TIGR03435 family)
MITAIIDLMLAAGGSLAGLIVLKVTVVATLGLAVAWLARRSRAAVRHALLAVMFGALLVLPMASVFAPPVRVTVPVTEVRRAASPLVVNTTALLPLVADDDNGARVAPAAPQRSPSFSLSFLLLAGWIAGTAVFLIPMLIGLWQIRCLRRSGLPWLDGQSIAEGLALDAGIHRRVEILLHEALPGPITCGVLGPAIVLPRDAESWPREDLNRAIVHELEHVRRGDSATRFLARAVCALYWFHPLTWIGWRKLLLEAERSCDDAVLRCSEATAYADQLVELAKRLPTAQRSPLLAMASRSDLAARVSAVLDGGQRRGRAGALLLGLATSCAVALVIALSPLIVVAMPQAIPAGTVAPQKSDTASGKLADLTVQGQQSHKHSDPVRLLAQAQPTPTTVVAPTPHPKPQFEAVSIHRCDGTSGRSGPARATPGHITAECATLGGPFPGLISESFGMFSDGHRHSPTLSPPVEGGPSWINSERYTILAKAEGDDPGEGAMIGPMLQAVLEDRFKLKLHHETREIPVYALTITKSGSKLHEAVGPACVPVAGKPCLAGMQVQGHNLILNLRGTVRQFAETLMASLDRPIVDKTDLTGTYDLHLEFAIDQVTTPAFAALATAGDPTGGVSIFTAIQEQLGLKLEPTKGPGDFIVIDHVERPSEN